MKAAEWYSLKEKITAAGYGSDVRWAEELRPCSNATDFSREHAFVVCNSGMRAQVAVPIFRRVWDAVEAEADPHAVFNHRGKVNAILYVYRQRVRLFDYYGLQVTDEARLVMLGTLPYIGGITKYHLAKNLGVDCFKPDRHIQRIAGRYRKTPVEMFRDLHAETGLRLNLLDVVIWRAANLRLI